MIKAISDFITKKPKESEYINKETLENIVDIAKKDHGNILVFFSHDSYEDYTNSIDVLSKYIDNNMQDLPFKQRKNRMDTGSSTVFENIQHDLDSVKKDVLVKRIILSVFTKSQAELDELLNKCASLEGVSIHIV